MNCECRIGGGPEGICDPCRQNAYLRKRIETLEKINRPKPMSTKNTDVTITLPQAIEDLNKDIDRKLKHWLEKKQFSDEEAPKIKTILEYFKYQEEQAPDTTHDLETMRNVAAALKESSDPFQRVMGEMLQNARSRVKLALQYIDPNQFSQTFERAADKTEDNAH
jgi:hypothetical protein